MRKTTERLVSAQKLIAFGAWLGALAIILGAFGAHGLRDQLSERNLETYHTAAYYHLVHSLLLILLGILAQQVPGKAAALGKMGLLVMLGMLVFSGSLYTLAITGDTRLGMITPLGGLLFIISWSWLGFSFCSEKQRRTVVGE